ncbi:MAG: hypothetical protein LBU82_04685, partial [Treponema sp.]|nr:hypothetical protein [Treponema sp.]
MKTAFMTVLAALALCAAGCQADKKLSPDFAGISVARPFVSYEAEDAGYKGTLLEFSAAYHEIQSEASGRRAVKLEAVGDYTSFTLKDTSNAVVLRYCLPDGEAGGGTSSLLAVYADGEKAGTILLSSKFAWIYNYAGGWPGSNDPAAGPPCRFFDDARFFFGCGLPEGTRIVFKKEDEDGWCVIDMAEFELI